MLEMKKPDAMGDAISQRKGSGLDVTILLGIPDDLKGLQSGDSVDSANSESAPEELNDEKNNDELGLAPEAAPIEEGDNSPMQSMMNKRGLPPPKMLGRMKPKA